MRCVRAVDMLDTLRDVFLSSFMNRSNMFARFMPRTIAGRKLDRVMRLLPFRIREGVRFVSFTAGRRLQEFLAAPKRHRHQARHVESRARCGDSANDPEQ